MLSLLAYSHMFSFLNLDDLVNIPALEFNKASRMGGDPTTLAVVALVRIHERGVTTGGNGGITTGKQMVVFVLAVGDPFLPVRLDELDGEKLTLGGLNQRLEFRIHVCIMVDVAVRVNQFLHPFVRGRHPPTYACLRGGECQRTPP